MGITKRNAGKLRKGGYRRDMKRTWWSETPFYNLYMLREATAIFTLIFTIMLIFGLAAVAQSETAFVSWAAGMSRGPVMWFSVIAFFMALYHTYTWFDATPKVMPLQRGDKKVPAHQIVIAHWAIFFVLTLIVLALAGLK